MKNLLFFFLFLSPLSLVAQNTGKVLSLDSAVAHIAKQVDLYPQEKIYLQTDKPYYITGEKIFFRAHIVDALLNIPSAYSRYVYAELINPLDSVSIRLKLKPDEKGLFFGNFTLPEDLPEGTYKICAYTNFMRNQGEEYFFTKTVRIGDPYLLNVKTETNFSFEEDKKVNLDIRFADLKDGKYLTPKSINIRLNKGKTMTLKGDKEGLFSVKLNLLHNAPERVLYIEMEDDRVCRQYLRIPYPEGKYDVSIYPEGGYLITGATCNVAFKSMKSNGLPENITGEIVNSKGKIIASVSTAHDGMGSFVITPEAGEKYTLVSKNDKGLEVRFDLPESRSDTYGLKVNISRDKVWVMVNAPANSPKDTLYLLTHQGGIVQYSGQWNWSKEHLIFSEQDFSSGMVHLLLLSADMKPISERLIFVMNDDQGKASIGTDKPVYKKREKVTTQIEIKNAGGEPLAGTFSLAVTDDGEVKTDTCRNILETLLLSSELKGYINAPAYYLADNKKSQMAVDLLMMTQGWRRYDIPRVLQGEITSLKYPLEAGQVITGRVKGGLLSKPSDRARVSIMSLNNGFMPQIADTDKDGYFMFQGFEMPDSSKFVVHAISKKGSKGVEVILDKDTFPEHTLPWIYQQLDNDKAFMDYISKADKQYTYENGIRMVNLKEVTVRATRRPLMEERSNYYSMADNSLTEEDISHMGYTTLRTMLYRFPGIQVGPDRVSIRGASGNPLLIIDGMEVELDMLDIVYSSDIEQIDLLKSPGNLAAYGSRGGNGVIAVYTKTGEINFREELTNIKTYTPLGYSQPVEFYSPVYDTPEKKSEEKPDLRTTIYWKPDVVTDETGKTSLEFYTADPETTYSIILEGIAKNGKIIRYQGKIERK